MTIKNKNRNKFISVALSIMLLLSMFATVVSANEVNLTALEKTEVMVKETMEKAKIPKVSIAIVQDEVVQYAGFSNDDTPVDEMSLFQIGSTTKAFTGLGILLLEDEGLLSIDDPVSKYLPWFTVNYQGEAVENKDLTIANLLYQTSGFTNNENIYPLAEIDMSLEQSIQQLVGLELMSYPSEKYAYSNVNFNVLGLIIEKVSSQTYSEFMTEQIFLPLGLSNTYTDIEQAQQTGVLIEGSKLSFLNTYIIEVPRAIGTIPAGYLASNTRDMSRWLQIQMGIIKVSPQFTRIIEKSHIPNPKAVVDANTHYAAGWFVDNTNGEVYHTGGVINYTSKVILNTDNKTAVCVLANLNAHTNTAQIADNTMKILDDKPIQSVKADIWLIFDNIFTAITFISVLLILVSVVYFAVTTIQIKKGLRVKSKRDKRNVSLIVFSVLLLLISIAQIVALQQIFGVSWSRIVIWAPNSVLWGTVGLTSLSVILLVISLVFGKYQR